MDNLTMQIEGDRRLLEFETYEEYLDSIVTCRDVTYLRSIMNCRIIAELGFRSSGDTLTREQFYKRLEACKNFFFPTSLAIEVVHKHADVRGNLLHALATRESDNRRGKLATIIFLRMKTKKGFEISAYIDYTDRLFKEDWLPVFQGRTKLEPSLEDLSYFHWKYGTMRTTNSVNFKVVIDSQLGLQFQCWHDRKMINVNPNMVHPWHSARIRIPTDDYEQVILYDHVVQRRC